MKAKTEAGISVKGFYELRSGKCPDCGTSFDDRFEPEGNKRYCPLCLQYKLGILKQSGVMKGK